MDTVDPTPTWEALSGRLHATIRSVENILAHGEHLDGPRRIAVADALNRHGTPLILAIEAILRAPTSAA